MPDSTKAFVSYSRDDLDFVLRLCQDLRQAGAAIWLDKLDITPGEEWDLAVERGLAECGRMLVVLSPRSVASQNVLDEVGFALTKKKVVVPVLFQDCEIPYRLSRLQYVDVRSNYEGALRELLSALQDTKEARTWPATPSVADTAGPGFATRPVILAAAVLAIIVVGLLVRNRLSPAAPSREAFRSALQQYIDAAPNGFQTVGAREFVDWTPSVIVPAAQNCRGSGYPRDPVIECVLYRTNSEVEAADRFEDAIELVQTSLPD